MKKLGLLSCFAEKSVKALLNRRSLSVLGLVIAVLAVSGCTGTANVPRGWSGGVIADDLLFVFSMEGKMVAFDTTTGAHQWEISLMETGTGGGFGCAPSSKAVAVYGTPAVSDNTVYIGGYNGKIYAAVYGREEPRWIYPREGSLGAPIVGGTVVYGDRVYLAAADGKVYALDAAEGHKEWIFDIGDKVWSTPAIEDDTLFIGSFDNKLYAVDTARGNKIWEFEVGGAIVATPLVDNGIVYFGSFDRHLYAVNTGSGQQIWKFPADDEAEDLPGNWFWSTPVIDDNIIYAGSLDGKVYVLDAATGRAVSGFSYYDLGSAISSSPVIAEGSVIVATDEGIVYALSDNKQRQLADLEEKIRSPLVASQGTVYVHTASDSLYAIDIETGAVRSFALGN